MWLRNCMVGVVASVMPWMVQAGDKVPDGPQRVDGLAVYLDVQPAAMAADWDGFHRPTGSDTVTHSTRPELDRHIVVVVIDEKAGRRVDDAAIDVVITPAVPLGRSFVSSLERMTFGTNASYGTVVTIDPASRYVIEVAVKRPGVGHESRVRFNAQAT